MKKLLNTLYITSEESYLSLDGENVVVLKKGIEAARIPLHNLEGIVTFGYTGASPALMGACARHNITLVFLKNNGRFIARVTGEQKGNVILRKQQYKLTENENECCKVSKSLIIGKIFNARWVIERAIRDYELRLDVARLKIASNALADSIRMVHESNDLAQLRGIEGKAATYYFDVFDELILQQKDNFYFHSRNKRPPLDNVNALLSFVYMLLAVNVASALETVGLDPYVGFMHTIRSGRASLALDIMEELRPVCADRFVLSLINKREVKPEGFKQMENGAVLMNDDTRKTVLKAWQNKKQEKITHPFLQEKIEWGMVPYAQALLLARYIRSDIDAYPPFLWK